MSDTEKDPFDALAAENAPAEATEPPADADDMDFEFEEIVVTAPADSFGDAKIFGGQRIALEDGQWVPVVILEARLTKGTQDFNMGVPQIQVYCEHLDEKYIPGRKFPYRAWCSLQEAVSQKGNKRYPGAKLLEVTGLMAPPADGESVSEVRITRDMVRKSQDDEGNDTIIFPALEGKEVMAQIQIKEGKLEPKLDADGNDTGETVRGFDKEQMRDMVSSVPTRIIEVISPTGKSGQMEVDYGSAANLMAPIRPGTAVDARAVLDNGMPGMDLYRVQRTQDGRWRLNVGGDQVESSKEEALSDMFN